MTPVSRDHIEAAKAAGVTWLQEADEPPPCPSVFAHLMEWFAELSAQRPPAMHGVAPISWTDFLAWQTATQRAPTALEVRLVMLLDRLYREAAARMREREERKREAQSKSGGGPGRG